ncbi:hypothetical protein VTK73DRAFT_4663 [Phialemonium thermophilum]|uniref:Uncharacterized protein n=1 Tax=Phialemonium thermophilum TaxID=223376 RepID=A0ABR3V6Y6_9PEZI
MHSSWARAVSIHDGGDLGHLQEGTPDRDMLISRLVSISFHPRRSTRCLVRVRSSQDPRSLPSP